jgi:hypothetical protein
MTGFDITAGNAPSEETSLKQSPATLSDMARTTVSIRKARRSSYATARRLGDVQAAIRGPEAYGRRMVPTKVGRSTQRDLGRTLRGVGL